VDELVASLIETLEMLDGVVRDLTERLAEGAAIYSNDPVFRRAVDEISEEDAAERVGDKSLRKKLRKQSNITPRVLKRRVAGPPSPPQPADRPVCRAVAGCRPV
jgi:hypothetical protein